MTHRVLAVDYRMNHPNRRRFARECLPDGCELIIPDSFDTDTLLREAKTARAMITSFEPITEEMIRSAPDLCAVGKAGTGVDMIDTEAATRAGIPVLNSPGSLRSDAIAEHALLLMMMVSRRPWLWGEYQTPILHNELMGGTLGIVGLGNIGQSVAKRCAAFGMKIIAHTRTPGKFRPEGFEIEETETLDELFPRVDYLLLSLPLSPQTQGMIGAREFELMKKGAFLINIARGGHVVTDDLADSFREGKLAGAGLDVTEPEPLPEGHPLLELPNAVISPHNATHSEGVQRRSYGLLGENIRKAIEGERVTSLANPEIYG